MQVVYGRRSEALGKASIMPSRSKAQTAPASQRRKEGCEHDGAMLCNCTYGLLVSAARHPACNNMYRAIRYALYMQRM